MDYRTAATSNNGGVFLRFPQPATVGDIDRGGYQVAILDNGSNAAPATQRTGALTQERVTPTTFAATALPTTTYKPTREWNTLTIKAVRSHIEIVRQRRAREQLRHRDPQQPRRLHRPRERGQQPDVPQRPHQGARAGHGRADGHRRRPGPPLARPGRRAELQLRGRVGARDVRRDARRQARHQRRAAQRDARPHTLVVTATDAEGHTTTRTIPYDVVASAGGTVGGSVPATLALTLGAPATFGPFTPGVAKTYTAQTTATVTSTAGDATLTVADPAGTMRLVNGAFTLAQPLATNLPKSWAAPTTNESVPITFSQAIGATERAADRRLRQDADVHAVHHHAVTASVHFLGLQPEEVDGHAS